MTTRLIRLPRLSIGCAVLAALFGCAATDGPRAYTAASGGVVIWEGALIEDEVAHFLQSNESKETLRELRFVNSPGGDISAMERLRRLVRERDLAVSASGYCVSACTLVFMSSRHRSLLEGPGYSTTFLHFHGAYRPNSGKYVDSLRDTELDELKQRTGGNFPADLYREARGAVNPRGGLYVYLHPVAADVAGNTRASTFVCNGDEKHLPEDCRAVPGVTPQTLGIVAADH